MKMEIYAGSEIRNTIGEAIASAIKSKDVVEFEFNGVTVLVASDSRADLIYRDWHRGLMGYLGDSPTVGPHPVDELSQSELDSDAHIEAGNERRRQSAQAEQKRKDDLKRDRLHGLLQDAPKLDVIDQSSWDQFVSANTDAYGGRVVRFAEEWGRLMQAHLRPGMSKKQVKEKLQAIAEPCSHDADDDGITGFMYGCAVSMLARCWRHGEDLRKWHNKEYDHHGDGVVNPALLKVGF